MNIHIKELFEWTPKMCSIQDHIKVPGQSSVMMTDGLNSSFVV